jgi:hypothetical protein
MGTERDDLEPLRNFSVGMTWDIARLLLAFAAIIAADTIASRLAGVNLIQW